MSNRTSVLRSLVTRTLDSVIEDLITLLQRLNRDTFIYNSGIRYVSAPETGKANITIKRVATSTETGTATNYSTRVLHRNNSEVGEALSYADYPNGIASNQELSMSDDRMIDVTKGDVLSVAFTDTGSGSGDSEDNYIITVEVLKNGV